MRWLLLNELRSGADFVLLLMRVVVGAFLIWGVWDNITSTARMEEFESFLRSQGFAAPAFLAPLSVWAQFFCGVCFVLGIATRWAGFICAFNFIVALAMVDAKLGIRAALSSTLLILLGLYFATRGAGRFSIDNRLASALPP
jgi:putative oxidoreductase